MKRTIIFLSFLFTITGCSGMGDMQNDSLGGLDDDSTDGLLTVRTNPSQTSQTNSSQTVRANSIAYFASGCFWCVEAIFESVEGVGDVVSGYAGGKATTARYELVSAGKTKHAEAVMVPYDSSKIDYETLLKVFFGSHDPTTLNQQGPDRGKQYRSSIFYQNKTEQEKAQTYIQQLLKEGVFSKITTEVVPLEGFYAAEDYHQDFEQNNPNNGYVKAVSIPRLNKFKEKYPELLK